MFRNERQYLPFLETSTVQCPSFLQSLSPVRSVHYFILLIPSSSLGWKLSSQLLPTECRDRLSQYVLGCSVPPSNTQQPYVAVTHWSKVRQPKHSSISGFCHLFHFSASLRLHPPWAGICLGLVCKQTYPEWAILKMQFALGLRVPCSL